MHALFRGGLVFLLVSADVIWVQEARGRAQVSHFDVLMGGRVPFVLGTRSWRKDQKKQHTCIFSIF